MYTHHVVREWVRLRQHTHLGSSLAQPGSPAGYPGSEGVKFFLVPLGVKGRESPLSMQLAARDAQYGHLFLSDHWIELWEVRCEGVGQEGGETGSKLLRREDGQEARARARLMLMLL